MNSQDTEGLLLGERAFLKLRELLTDDGLRAGQFVSMPDLVKLLGFPLAPTREAVKRAETMSLVTVVPKRGVLVMEATPAIVWETYDLRSIFDQEGARRIVGNIDADKLETLKRTHERILELAENGVTRSLQKEAMEVDWSLHQALADALDNPVAQSIYSLNRDKIAIIQRARPLLPDRIRPAMEEHLEILAAIARGDGELAAQMVRDHYRHTLRWWGLVG